MAIKNPVLTATRWPTNAHLIADVAKLRYLDDSSLTLDATYGKGNFWSIYRPHRLVTSDGHKTAMITADFTTLPFADETFDRVVFDPPYKLNGTPTEYADRPYGVHVYTRWHDRMRLMARGLIECGRVVKKGGMVLAKCQDQVVSGKIRFQTDYLTRIGEGIGLDKIDVLHLLTDPRSQPHTRQVHSRRNYSTLLVFQKV